MSSLIPYDPQRLLAYQPETATQWAERHRTVSYGEYQGKTMWGESGAVPPMNLEEARKVLTGFHEAMRKRIQDVVDAFQINFEAMMRDAESRRADTLVLADYAPVQAAALRSMMRSGQAVTIFTPGKEARVLTPEEVDEMVSASPHGVLLRHDRYPNGGYIEGNRQMRHYIDAARHAPAFELQERRKTTKQNGRSSAYLKHDPTKNGRTKR